MNTPALTAPFPWFGGKSRVADLVWAALGDTPNYIEPFFGSGAVLLGRPPTIHARAIETVNDKDGLLANFWRAVQHAPEQVAEWADWPVNECDLHARHLWLLGQKDGLADRLCADPDYFDAKVAGWWVWGICAWIGSGWCSGNGPWQAIDGKLQLPHLGNAGQGINRQLPHLSHAGSGINRKLDSVANWMQRLSARLRDVRVCCGDWQRICGDSPTIKNGLTAVFLDPPYADTADRAGNLYNEDCLSVAHAVREWALERGDNPLFRIAMCGYDGEHQMPANWECVPWKAKGGYGSQAKGAANENAARERIWFSPHCRKIGRLAGLPLFAAQAAA